MTLPDKVQKNHFSREEQLLLAGYVQNVIPDAADEVFYRLGHQRNQSTPSLKTFSDSTESSISSIDEELLFDTGSDMEDSMLDGFRWMEDEDDLDLTLDDYHHHMVSTAIPSKKPFYPQLSFRRSMSLTHIPLNSPTLSSFKPQQTPKPIELPPGLPQLSHQRTNSRPQQGPPCAKDTRQHLTLTTDSSTKHYQDPEARLKLRVYLASPQKFDEVIEFGFPALEDKETIPPSRPSLTKHHHTDSILQTFFHDDNPSIINALIDDDDPSSPESDQPKTPRSVTFRPYLLPPSTSSSEIPHKSSDPYGPILTGPREMTLKMTLTRPDLRKHETSLVATGDDPLTLMHLPPVRDANDIWDTRPKDGVVKKLWHKMSRKSSAV